MERNYEKLYHEELKHQLEIHAQAVQHCYDNQDIEQARGYHIEMNRLHDIQLECLRDTLSRKAKDYRSLYRDELAHQFDIHIQANSRCVTRGDTTQYRIHDEEISRLTRLYSDMRPRIRFK